MERLDDETIWLQLGYNSYNYMIYVYMRRRRSRSPGRPGAGLVVASSLTTNEPHGHMNQYQYHDISNIKSITKGLVLGRLGCGLWL